MTINCTFRQLMKQSPNNLPEFWSQKLSKNIAYLQNQVKVDMKSCVLWQNSNDWHVTPNPRVVPTYFILMPIQGRVMVNTDRGKHYIEKGRFVFLKPNTWHALDANPDFGDLEQISLHCHLSDPGYSPLNIDALPEIHVLDNPEFLIQKWLALVYQINSDFSWGYRTGEIFVKLLLEEILKKNQEFDFHSVELDDRMKRAVDYIHQNFTKEISIEEIAASVSLKPVRFRNCFQEALGVAPKSYLINLRLKKACDLLLHHNDSIKEIAYKIGFSQNDYFHKCFKERFHTTPQDFRNNKKTIF